MPQSRTKAYVGILFAIAFWGASFIATKFALRDVSPATVVWLRFGMGVIILGAAMLIRRQFAVIPPRQWPFLALLGFLGIAFHQFLQSTALVTSQATTTAWIVTTAPVFIALLGFFVLHEHLGAVRVLGIALAMLGVLLVVTKGNPASLFDGQFGAPGDILNMISALNWAVFSVLSRRELDRHPPTRMMFFVMLFGWLFSAVPFFAGAGFADIARLSLNGWLGVAFLGIFCSGLAYIFWYDALKQIPAAQVGIFLSIEPFVTLVVAGLLLGESFSALGLFGGIIILASVWLVNRPARLKNDVGELEQETRSVATGE
jgi:drug/metabolite transporter (DMT)-like permease